ncbi:MAG: 16S rRNA (adenine(1518)-N(6)/adenine(1519)-N(6))-dimethyltransferase RsmA [Bacteroidota bacterium]
MRAKKSYGQHFLVNEAISERIANSLNLNHYKVLEIGPGQGMLTKYLLEKDYELYAVEADRDMVAHLKIHYPELGDRLHFADFMRFRLDQLFQAESFAIIGNFPYNISSQILFKMLDHRQSVPELVGMFQKEMAERVVAKPGGKEYGVISVLVQAFYKGEYLFTVKRGHFNPPPKVTSAVIRLTRKTNQNLGCDYKLFRQIVKQTFGQRRKMLRNTMKPFLKGSDLLKEDFFQQRPERLSVEDFVQLTNWVEEART